MFLPLMKMPTKSRFYRPTAENELPTPLTFSLCQKQAPMVTFLAGFSYPEGSMSSSLPGLGLMN